MTTELFRCFTNAVITENSHGCYLTFKWSISRVTSQMVVGIFSAFGGSDTGKKPRTRCPNPREFLVVR
jgi:hypothetical protein